MAETKALRDLVSECLKVLVSISKKLDEILLELANRCASK